MKRPSAVPITPQIVAGKPRIALASDDAPRIRPVSASAPRNETNENSPNASSAHDPRLIGLHGLNTSPPPLVSTSM